MSIKRLHANKRMSQVVIHNGLAYLSGQVCEDVQGDIEKQTKQTLATIEKLLGEAGTDKTRILSATIYLKDIEKDFENMNRVWDTWLPEGVTPARATIEAKMCEPELLIEISIVATLP
ncbi:RidA family protein [Entomomonas asaccharolytica]|uniref:RidA family protein n=1 Tax=Entomomonas asaccharolytica TaxID=2785331 RepID=A0A974RX85_9GAMM|nr:RidA family protein [Entomomonas asaccharolytica]QQP85927.1 RidA family protein [Entomomonas asaccharolytica]